MKRPGVFCFTAHPEDEEGGFGGTLLRYDTRGVETPLVCLTPGQAATHRGGAKSDRELAAMRRNEFAASTNLLQVSCSTVLEYPDGKLGRQDFYAVVGEITRGIRGNPPQRGLAIGPEGGGTARP